jgi:hypothetical protein
MREGRAHILLPRIFPGRALDGTVARAMQKRPPGGKTMRTVKALALVVTVMSALVSLSALTGCVRVAPYERGTLAHPTMSPDDMSSGVDEHVRAVSEGATGGFGGGGGGCGCN